MINAPIETHIDTRLMRDGVEISAIVTEEVDNYI